MDWTPLAKDPVAGLCKHGSESSGYIQGLQFLEYLSDYQLLRKYSAPCN
jgi:hypothetical protein